MTNTSDLIEKLLALPTYWDGDQKLACTPLCLSAAQRDLLVHVLKTMSSCIATACTSGMSWSGNNIVGDRKSIDEVKRLIHTESIVEHLRQRLRCTETALNNTKEALDESRKAVTFYSAGPNGY